MRIVSWNAVEAKEQQALLTRPAMNGASGITTTVMTIVNRIRTEGDLALKEYTAKFDAGLGLDSSTFYTFYFLLTGFHFFHVLAACVFLFFVWWTVRRTTSSEDMEHALDTAAAFWHMVDLLWIVLFPLLYLMP